jgi:AraC-like DNA-binding protein
MNLAIQGGMRIGSTEALISSRIARTENVRVEFMRCRIQATVQWNVVGSEISLMWMRNPALDERISKPSGSDDRWAKANIWFFPEGSDAEGELTAESDYECAGIFVEPSFLSPAAKQVLTKPVARFSDGALGRKFNELVRELTGQDEVLPLFAEGCVMQALAYVARASDAPQPEQAPTSNGLASWQLHRAKELLSAGLADNVSIRLVAAACKLSVSHFSRAFKASTGLAPHQWVMAARIELARELLTKSTMSLVDVADECGFSDQSHFTRTFGRFTGATPSSWRREQGLAPAALWQHA